MPNLEHLPPWDTVINLAEIIDPESWLLVGGLMVQAHAMLAGYESRATSDIDMLIDVMADSTSVRRVIAALESIGFEKQEPGLRGTAFHRLKQGEFVVDVLVADHLPSGKRRSAMVDVWPMMEIPGGAQAIERRMQVTLATATGESTIYTPNLLGSLILKSAAYAADKRDRERHLEDIALLSSLITDHSQVLDELHGSDRKRLRTASAALKNPNHPAWLKLDEVDRERGQETLRILSPRAYEKSSSDRSR
jgi:hypothetical protein